MSPGGEIGHLHALIVYKFWEPQPPETQEAFSGLYRDTFTFT
jgi:hypothetical protein